MKKEFEVLTVEKIGTKAIPESNYFDSFEEAMDYADKVFDDTMLKISVYKNNFLVMDVL